MPSKQNETLSTLYNPGLGDHANDVLKRSRCGNRVPLVNRQTGPGGLFECELATRRWAGPETL